jgi:flavin reductase (DIM6/NTAB) family NADH-FMN oxidoreductase RutF
MTKRQVVPHRPIYPTPAGLITSVDATGRPNIITLGEVFNISIARPVILGIAIRKERYSHQLISETREYVVNLPTQEIAEQVWYCGSVSGRAVNKFVESGLTPVPAQRVRPPLIAECPVNLECKLLGVQEIGDHDLFLGEVVVEHVNEGILDEAGRISVDKLHGFAFVAGEFWTLGERMPRP